MLEQGHITHERQERLWFYSAAARPQTGSTTTAQDNRGNLLHVALPPLNQENWHGECHTKARKSTHIDDVPNLLHFAQRHKTEEIFAPAGVFSCEDAGPTISA
ncbi:hypothetical protein [Novosphingobium sp. SCN 63-17]|uniref:hypothetical protein n=1 Tax=Novosphingobium sp. SCN 63-17 TaxID=1660120 RepID=UPI0025D073B8|nr:hypothetical protein [Novosphingobium sp. SCN 63-17]